MRGNGKSKGSKAEKAKTSSPETPASAGEKRQADAASSKPGKAAKKAVASLKSPLVAPLPEVEAALMALSLIPLTGAHGLSEAVLRARWAHSLLSQGPILMAEASSLAMTLDVHNPPSVMGPLLAILREKVEARIVEEHGPIHELCDFQFIFATTNRRPAEDSFSMLAGHLDLALERNLATTALRVPPSFLAQKGKGDGHFSGTLKEAIIPDGQYPQASVPRSLRGFWFKGAGGKVGMRLELEGVPGWFAESSPEETDAALLATDRGGTLLFTPSVPKGKKHVKGASSDRLYFVVAAGSGHAQGAPRMAGVDEETVWQQLEMDVHVAASCGALLTSKFPELAAGPSAGKKEDKKGPLLLEYMGGAGHAVAQYKHFLEMKIRERDFASDLLSPDIGSAADPQRPPLVDLIWHLHLCGGRYVRDMSVLITHEEDKGCLVQHQPILGQESVLRYQAARCTYKDLNVTGHVAEPPLDEKFWPRPSTVLREYQLGHGEIESGSEEDYSEDEDEYYDDGCC